MAKSIRSKRKRKFRAVKRERYGKKELDRLKKTLGVDDTQTGSKDVDMTQISEVANVIDSKTLVKNQVNEDEMEEDDVKKIFNAKTLRDEHGAYPVWLHPRKINKNRLRKKKVQKGKKKKH